MHVKITVETHLKYIITRVKQIPIKVLVHVTVPMVSMIVTDVIVVSITIISISCLSLSLRYALCNNNVKIFWTIFPG